MRWVLRRLLWLGPALVLVTLVSFGALELALPRGPIERELPLFFNPDPGGVDRLVARALRVLADPAQPDDGARREIARLGGAALPYILPALDSLSPEGRARAAAALRPVGARMGLELDERWDPSREVLFWTRFWEEHSIDYRPSVARRAVLRLAQKSTLLRDTEVRQLDTYALNELIAQMPPVETAADVERVRRLSQLASDVTGGEGPVLAEGAGVDDARAAALSWSFFWARHHADFVTYDGTERLLAMLRDTRYGEWLSRAARHELGIAADGRSIWDHIRDRASVTLPLFLCGLASVWGWALGWSAAVSHGWRGWARVLYGIGWLRAFAPAVVVAVVLRAALARASGELWVGMIVMGASSVPLASLYRGAASGSESEGVLRTLRAFGASPLRTLWTTLRLSSASLFVQVGAHVSTLLTLTFVVEHALDLPGLGPSTIDALHEPDVNWLMGVIICTSLFVGALHASAELLLMLVDPRTREADRREREGTA